MAYRVQAKGFARQTLDAIALMRTLDVFFGDRKTKASRGAFRFARQDNDPVTRESYGVIKYMLEFGRAKQARALVETEGAQCTPKLNGKGSCDPWRGAR